MIFTLALALMQSPVPSASFEDSMAQRPAEMSFWAGYSRSDAGTWVVEIYTRRFQDRGEYVLRRSLRTPSGREQARWTTSTSCPVVLNIIPSMERLSLGSLVAPPLETAPQPWFVFPQSIPAQPDSAGYALWGQGRLPDGALAHYRVTAGNGLIPDFIDRAEEALQPCWAETLEH